MPRAVIYESGSPIASALERSGIQPTADQLLAYKTKVAGDTHTVHKRVAAVVKQGERIATNPSWTLDLTSWFTAPFANTAVAALVRFDYLEPDGGQGGTGPGQGFSGECLVITANTMCQIGGGNGNCQNPHAVFQQQACPSGSQEVATFPVCPPMGQMTFMATPVGSISYATYEDINVSGGWCWTPCAGTHPCNETAANNSGSPWQTDLFRQDLRINDQTIARPLCEERFDTNGVITEFGSQCGYVRASRPWANPTVLSSNPRHVLCCTAN